MKSRHALRDCLACLCAAVLLCVGGCEKDPGWGKVLSQVREDFPDVRMISTQQLADWQADTGREQPLLLDVRAVKEYEVSHLRGAVLADTDSGRREALHNTPKDRPIVVYCSVGYRSAAAARKIKAMGFTNVSNLEGSIFAWANEGRPIYRDGGEPATRVHPYDDRWGKLLDKRYHPAGE